MHLNPGLFQNLCLPGAQYHIFPTAWSKDILSKSFLPDFLRNNKTVFSWTMQLSTSLSAFIKPLHLFWLSWHLYFIVSSFLYLFFSSISGTGLTTNTSFLSHYCRRNEQLLSSSVLTITLASFSISVTSISSFQSFASQKTGKKDVSRSNGFEKP